MGQRQLVALMRVLVQQPAIFILDEATASIDPFTEWQIQHALDLILQQSTSILIAHRLSTVKSADRIIVMENGAHHRRGQPQRAAGGRRALRHAVQHLLQAPVAWSTWSRRGKWLPGWGKTRFDIPPRKLKDYLSNFVVY